MTPKKPTTKKPSNKPKFRLWKAKDGWRWNIKTSGRLIDESGEGYRNINDAVRPLLNVLRCAVYIEAQVVSEMERVRDGKQ